MAADWLSNLTSSVKSFVKDPYSGLSTPNTSRNRLPSHKIQVRRSAPSISRVKLSNNVENRFRDSFAKFKQNRTDRQQKIKLGAANVAKSLDKDPNKPGIQLIPGGWEGGVNRVKTSFRQAPQRIRAEIQRDLAKPSPRGTGNLLMDTGNLVANVALHPQQGRAIFKKRIIEPPVKFAQTLGKAAALPETNKLFDENQKLNMDQADLYIQKAIVANQAGDRKKAKIFFEAASEARSRAIASADQRTTEMGELGAYNNTGHVLNDLVSFLQTDLGKSGVGTANVAGMLAKPGATAKMLGTGGLLNTAIGAASGQKVDNNSFWGGVDSTSKYAGLVNVSNPFIAGLVDKYSVNVQNPIFKSLVARVISGLGNIGEDYVLDKIYDEQTFNPALSFGIGFILQGGGEGDLKQLKTELTTFGLTPKDAETMANFLQTQKQFYQDAMKNSGPEGGFIKLGAEPEAKSRLQPKDELQPKTKAVELGPDTQTDQLIKNTNVVVEKLPSDFSKRVGSLIDGYHNGNFETQKFALKEAEQLLIDVAGKGVVDSVKNTNPPEKQFDAMVDILDDLRILQQQKTGVDVSTENLDEGKTITNALTGQEIPEPPVGQAGGINLGGFEEPELGKFEEPYKRGDKTALNRQIDQYIGYKSNGEHWKREFHTRNKMIDEFLNNPKAPQEFKNTLKQLIDQVDLATEAKATLDLEPKVEVPETQKVVGESKSDLSSKESITEIDETAQDVFKRQMKEQREAPKVEPEAPQLDEKAMAEGRNRLFGPEEKLEPEVRPKQSKLPKFHDPEEALASGKAEISKTKDGPKKTIRETYDEIITSWVNRFHPLEQLSKKVKADLKTKNAELRPEVDPEFTTRRFYGAGNIASQRHEFELKPIMDQLEEQKIDLEDMDVYLKASRDINLAERDIKGSDADLASARIEALKAKYGDKLDPIAQQLYGYQDRGFEDMVEAGFMDRKTADQIKGTNENYVPFQRVMDDIDEFLGISGTRVQQGESPIQKIEGSERQIHSPLESIIVNTYKQRMAIERNNVAQSVVGLQQVMPTIGIEPVSKSSSSTITVWENGKKRHYEVGEDIAAAVKGMNEEVMGTFAKIMSFPASILRTTATGMNPEFMIPNVIRDQFDAGINAKYGYTPFLDWGRGLLHLVKRDDVYQDWLKSGGAQSFTRLSGRKAVEEEISSATAKKRLRHWLKSGLEKVGELSEVPTRIGLFKKAQDATGSDLIAGYESREGTMDFARMGAKMRTLNAMIPFLNVKVQGFSKLIRNSLERPAQAALKVGLYGALPSALSTAYNLTYHPDEYNEIPQWEKDSNFIFVIGRDTEGKPKYVKIPKGHIGAVAANPTESVLNYLFNTDKPSFKSAALQLLGDVTPIEAGQTVGEAGVKTFGSSLPQAGKPIIENLLNRSFYKFSNAKGQPQEIVPYYLQNKPAVEQKFESTPRVYNVIGKLTNSSPLKVKNLLEGYFSGFAKIPVNIVEVMADAAEGKEINPNEIPILRRFIGSYQDTSKPKTTKKSTQSLFNIAKAKADDGTTLSDIPEDFDSLVEVYKKAKSQGTDFITKKAKIQSDPMLDDAEKQEKIADLFEKSSAWGELALRIESEKPEEFFKIELKTYGKGSDAGVENRGDWAAEKLAKLAGITEEGALDRKNVATDDWKDYVNKMWESGVLTTPSDGTLAHILNNYPDFTKADFKYTGDDAKINKKVNKAFAGKKITLTKANIPTPAKASSSRISLKIPESGQLDFTAPLPSRLAARPELDFLRMKAPDITKLPTFTGQRLKVRGL